MANLGCTADRRAMVIRILIASIFGWVLTVVVAYSFFFPTQAGARVAREIVVGSLFYNPLVVSVAAILIRLRYEAWLGGRVDSSRYQFGGFMAAVAASASIVVAAVLDLALFVMHGLSMDSPFQSIVGALFLLFVCGLPLWFFVGGLVVPVPSREAGITDGHA